MQDVFERHFDDYAKGRSLHSRELQAAHCIRSCYTEAQGSHLDYCPDGHVAQEQFHACRHRSCPRCAQGPRQAWLQRELQRLLPCPHFHLVFTMPHELLSLWEYNRKAFGQLLFDCVRTTLLELLADPRHLGALPGLLLSLHTWGRTLSHHPHIHALVTAGGVNAAGQWRAARDNYLLPLKPLHRLFCGKLIALLREVLPTWSLPPHLPQPHWLNLFGTLYRKHWNIQINPPYAHGKGVALYLARYAKGGPLPQDRALQLNAAHVSFGYTDHREHRAKHLRLPVNEFISRVLWHAPPKGAHTVRHAGLYASAGSRSRAAALIALACPAAPSPAQSAGVPANVAPPAIPKPACPTCAKPLLRLYLRPGPRTPNQISPLVSHCSAATPSTLPAPGPTGRCNGHLTAGPAPPPQNNRLRGAGCQMRLN